MLVDRFREFKHFIKCTLIVIMKVFVKFILRLLRNCNGGCLWILMLLSITIIYLISNCVILLNRDSCDARTKITRHNPVILWWTSFPGTRDTRECSYYTKCDTYSGFASSYPDNVGAYLFYGSEINGSYLPQRRAEDIWALYHEESPRNQELLMHEPMLSLFNFSATFSRYSDVPFPLQYLDSIEDVTSTEYFVPTSVKNNYLKELAPVMYLQTDCETSTERDDYVKELMKFIKVDSYGVCLNNKELPDKFKGDYLNNLDEDEFLNFIARYKFVVAIENGVCEDYITEKFWRPIKVGVVPIYFGSPSIRDWLPNDNSAILLDDFPTPEMLSAHLKKLLSNDVLYEEYLIHKTKSIITNSRLLTESLKTVHQDKTRISVETLECLVCESLHRKPRLGTKIVDKSHFNCPQPISALTLSVNPSNSWVSSWKDAKKKAEKLKERLTNN